jgi:bifunctional DNase/RNase
MGMESTPELKMVEMVVARIVLRDSARGQHIYLKEREGARGFTLVIGTWEAEEIRRVLAREEAPRPMTHQLALAIVRSLGGRVVRCDIVDFRDHTFFGQLAIESLDRKNLALIDARPSDAIAIALRAGAPVRVAEFVLEQVRSDSAGPDPLPGPPPWPPGTAPTKMPREAAEGSAPEPGASQEGADLEPNAPPEDEPESGPENGPENGPDDEPT